MSSAFIRYVYLVQGQAKNVKRFFPLIKRTHSTALLLTYDEPLEGAIYYPNSTWAEGRNHLLSQALQLENDFEYFIFVDDDTDFYLGGWDEWEQGLEAFKPQVAVPVVDRTTPSLLPYPLFKVQSFFYNDEQLMAFHRDVVKEGVLLPYNTNFDKIHWWATCRLQQILIQNLYATQSLQFNFIRVANLEHLRYQVQSNSDESYKDLVLEWVRDTYGQDFIDVNKVPTPTQSIERSMITFEQNKHKFEASPFGSVDESLHLIQPKNSISINEISSYGENNETFIIYGFGEIGQKILEHMRITGNDDRVIGIVDQKALNGTYTEDTYHIEAPSRLHDKNYDKVIVGSIRFLDEIESVLLSQYKLSRNDLIFVTVN